MNTEVRAPPFLQILPSFSSIQPPLCPLRLLLSLPAPPPPFTAPSVGLPEEQQPTRVELTSPPLPPHCCVQVLAVWVSAYVFVFKQPTQQQERRRQQ